MISFKTVLMGAAALTLVSSAAYTQDNQAFTAQPGDDNTLTINQQFSLGTGDAGGTGNNRVGRASSPFTLSGDDNVVTINQRGTGAVNRVDGEISGDVNELDVLQLGASNRLMTHISGDANDVVVLQTGVGNDADIEISGNTNFLDLEQRNRFQTADIVIRGSGNNVGETLFGAAATAAALLGTGVPNLNGGSLTAGELFQDGGFNRINLAVGTGANNNAYALYQLNDSAASAPDGNTIVGFITGDNNAAAVIQTGPNNHTNFSQAGTGNSLGITQ